MAHITNRGYFSPLRNSGAAEQVERLKALDTRTSRGHHAGPRRTCCVDDFVNSVVKTGAVEEQPPECLGVIKFDQPIRLRSVENGSTVDNN